MKQRYIIAVNSGVGLKVVGQTGIYLSNIEDAKIFDEPIEAYEYIERLGIEKISSVRKIKSN